MTYCVAISVKTGIIFCSDSRTNAGIDQISTYSKMHKFGKDGERQFALLAAGNLATTQAVITQLDNDIKQNAATNLYNAPSLNVAADYVGQISLEQQKKYGHTPVHEASFIIGGQIMGKKPSIHLVYPQGNHISSSKDTPYLQIGESKYGKPILDRILRVDMMLDTAAQCALVSMDSTMRSNLTVGPPIEVVVYETDSLLLNRHYRFEQESDYLRNLNRAWDERLNEAFRALPPIQWAQMWDQDNGETTTEVNQ